MARTIAESAVNMMILIDMERNAHQYDTEGVMTAWGPLAALAQRSRRCRQDNTRGYQRLHR